MDHSTEAPPELAVAVKQVESDTVVLAAALAGGRCGVLSHGELGELVATARRVLVATARRVLARTEAVLPAAAPEGLWVLSFGLRSAPADVQDARHCRSGCCPSEDCDDSWNC